MNETPCLREQVGSAMNTGNLSGRSADRLNAVAVGADRLGALLWRLKYGQDRRVATVLAAKTILVRRVHGTPGRIPGPMITHIVERALAYWLNDTCPECHGRQYTGTEYGDLRGIRLRCPAGCLRGKDGLTFTLDWGRTASERALNRVSCQRCAGAGWLSSTAVDSSKTTVCRTCHGEGTMRPSVGRIAASLGVTRKVYEQRWEAKYERALSILRAVDARTGDTVARAARELDFTPGLEKWTEEQLMDWQKNHLHPVVVGA